MVPDGDIMTNLQHHNGVSVMLSAATHAMICQVDTLLHKRCLDISDKKPGALIDEDFLKIIWVRMLKRPKNIVSLAFALRGKFNTILKERLADGYEDRHRIMSIEVQPEDFNVSSHLTIQGMHTFWTEVFKAIEKLDEDKILLKPHGLQNKKAKQQQSVQVPTECVQTQCKLPHLHLIKAISATITNVHHPNLAHQKARKVEDPEHHHALVVLQGTGSIEIEAGLTIDVSPAATTLITTMLSTIIESTLN